MFITLSLAIVATAALDRLPSPVTVEDACVANDAVAYMGLISATRTELRLIMNLPEPDRNELIRTWFERNRENRRKVRVSLQSRKFRLPHQYTITSDMDAIDLSKLDLVFLCQNKQPVFQARMWFNTLYNSRQDQKDFAIGSNGRTMPLVYRARSGPQRLMGLPSYDPILGIESISIENYVTNGFKSKYLVPMTYEKYGAKLRKAYDAEFGKQLL